ncbi:hypothetical protein M5689_006568 [Euphorbia peplus]|nr:hypothetical protein M5689_006568 [Euphorbia peplus]
MYNCLGEESLHVKSNENGLRNTGFLRMRADDNQLIEESIPIMFDDPLIKEVMDTYDELVMERTVEDALKDLKMRYESSDVIIAGIGSFEFLTSKGLNRDGMLKVVNAVYEEEKKKINSDLVLNKKSPMKMKMKNVMDFTGKDDELKGNIRGHKCRECKEVFASYQVLGGHTTSHNKKKKTEESIQISSKVTKIEIVPDNGGEELVYKCDLCPKIFRKGQGLGGHKMSHCEGGRKESTNKQVVKIHDFNLNMVASDVENYEFLSWPKSQTYSSSSEEDRD